MRTERRTGFVRGVVVRAAILAGLYSVFLALMHASLGESVLACGFVFALALAFGFLLHWRDIFEAVKARRRV